MTEPHDRNRTVDVPSTPVRDEPHDPSHTVDHSSAPADSLDAGLAAGFGPPRSSLGDLRPVLLKEAEGDSAHVVKPHTDAMPAKEVTGDRYLLQGEIARGGMGAVLRGRDVDLGRDLAIKVLLEKHANRPEVARRFIEEAQIGGQLQHPGVVPVYDIGRFGDRPFFTMKLVKGQTLQALLAERGDKRPAGLPDQPTSEPLVATELPRFLDIALKVAQAMAYAHAKGVIHRDLKPANIMVGAFGEVQVMDWGLAKVLAEGGIADEERASRQYQPEEGTLIRTARSTGSAGTFGTQTEAGSLLGTPAYMPPEQANGDIANLDRRADVFGMGAILCEVLTGKPPYVGRSHEEVRRKATNGNLADATARVDACGADAELIALTKTCLAAEATDRPKDAQAVADGLSGYLNGVQEKLRMAELAEAEARAKAAEEAKRRRLTLALAASVLVAMSLAGGGGLWYQQQVAAQREEAARREAELREAVRAALDKVTDLRQSARWSEARAVLEQVRQRLGPSGPEDLRHEVAQADKDLALVDRLDAARLKKSAWVDGHFDDASAAGEYAAALQEAGLGNETEPAEVVAARIRASAVRKQLVAAVDHYWGLSKENPRRRAWLLAVARAADPDPWRNRFRDPALWQDRAAVKRLARAAKVSELSPQILAGLGALLKESGMDAVPLLTAAQRRYPSDFWLNFDLGNVLRQAKRWDEAIGYYRAALALRPGTVAVYNNLGIALRDKGQVDEAIAEYQKALEIDPRFAYANHNLGRILCLEKRDYDGAIACFKKAIARDPKFAHAHAGLGVALKEKGQVDAAIACLREAIALDPKDAKAHTNLGNVLKDKGQVDEAIACHQKTIALDRKFAGAHNNLGIALRHKGQVDEAIACYKKAIGLDPNFADTYVSLGAILCDVKRDYDGAVASFNKAIKLKPKHALAHANRGIALSAKGLVDEAIASAEKAIALDPRLAQAHNALGLALKARGDLAGAMASWRKATLLDPNHAKAHGNLVAALRDKGQLDEAIVCCKKAIAGNPKDASFHNNLGALLHRKRRVDEAIACIRKAIELDPKLAAAHCNLGQVLAAEGQVDAGIACIRKAIELDPKDAGAHRSLGVALVGKGHLDEAIACYHKAIELDSNLALAHAALGAALKDKGRVDEAIACYRKSIQLDPKDARPHIELGSALRGKGQLDEAIGCLRKASELDPNSLDAHNSLGNALHDRGQVDEAIACFKKAIAIDPKDAAGHYNLGRALHLRGQLDGAIACYHKAIALKPTYPEAHCNLGGVLAGKGQVDEAILCFQKAIALNPKLAQAHTNLGIALAGKGQLDGAIACFKKVTLLDPKDPSAHIMLGNALRDKGQLDEAIACWRKVIALDPKFANAHLILGNLLREKGQVDEAIACYKKAITLEAKLALAHGALGQALVEKGRYAEARDATSRALELLPDKHPLRAFVSRQLRKCERCVKLEARLPRLLTGEDKPASAGEGLEVATQCYHKRKYAAAARFAAAAFAADPQLADDLKNGHRYGAACFAALAGKGEEAARLDARERARLRQQALAWLRADLALYTRRLGSGQGGTRALVQRELRHWQKDPDLAGIRDRVALAKLRAEERAACEKLWADVAALLKKAEAPAK
jgi:tetratricopeptide (TPR) repeat protein